MIRVAAAINMNAKAVQFQMSQYCHFWHPGYAFAYDEGVDFFL